MNDGILCPACGSARHKVHDSRAATESIIRRRTCLACETRFATEERVTHIIRMMDSITQARGRPEGFPTNSHIRVLLAIAAGASNKNQIALATNISATQVKRIVNRLVRAKMVSTILGSHVEDAHPLTTILDIAPAGAAFLAQSPRPKTCEDLR